MKHKKLILTLTLIIAVLLIVGISLMCYWFLPMAIDDTLDDGVCDRIAQQRLSRYDFFHTLNQDIHDLCAKIEFNYEKFPYTEEDFDSYDAYSDAEQAYYETKNLELAEEYNLAQNRRQAVHISRTFSYSFSEENDYVTLDVYKKEIELLAKVIADGKADSAMILFGTRLSINGTTQSHLTSDEYAIEDALSDVGITATGDTEYVVDLKALPMARQKKIPKHRAFFAGFGIFICFAVIGDRCRA